MTARPSPRPGIVDLLREAARAGGRAGRAGPPAEDMVAKEGRGNFVTAADRENERAILRLVRDASPHAAVLSEESPPGALEPLAEQHLWVIDPPDGTNNFRFDRRYS